MDSRVFVGNESQGHIVIGWAGCSFSSLGVYQREKTRRFLLVRR